jgi:geranylgeranyl diphosphate synthase type I
VQLAQRAGEVSAAVESVLTVELAVRRAEVAAIDPRLTDDVDRLVHHLFGGGKRLRPQFLCAGWQAATVGTAAVPAGVLKAAAALELIQACALIHDDIIDRSDTRRGSPSVHRSVQKLHADRGWFGDPAHFGLSTALLLGDLALAWADDLFATGLAEMGGPTEALAAWRAMRTEVLAGQLLDVRTTADRALDVEGAAADAMVVNRYKTAAYTVERPLHIGAALAGASPATITALRGYGTAIGLAFQLRDDLLGVFGNPAVTGKPAGDDLIEGKRTVLLAMARSALTDSPALLAELDGGVGTALGPAQVDRLTALIAQTAAPDATEARIAELLQTGLDALAVVDGAGHPLIGEAAGAALHSLALAATTRVR